MLPTRGGSHLTPTLFRRRRLSSSAAGDAAAIAKLINDLPIPIPFPTTTTVTTTTPFPFSAILKPADLTTALTDAVLGRLYSGHSNPLKPLHFFLFSLLSPFPPLPSSFHKTLLSLARSPRHHPHLLPLMAQTSSTHPTLFTPKATSIVLSHLARSRTFDETLAAFHEMERLFAPTNGDFGTDHFNALLRAFASNRSMKEARAVFTKLHSKYPPNSKTFNILLLGFKESGNILAMELFYHEMVRRGFKPNSVSYNIRIDAYCKKADLFAASRVAEEMEAAGFEMKAETLTTLIHGACIAWNPIRARQLFEEIKNRKIVPDVGVYNALLGSYVREGDLKGGFGLVAEMEEKGIACDDITYHTLIKGMRKFGEVEDVVSVYRKMVEIGFVPKMRTVVMLMKLFCESGRCDLGLELWDYMVGKGCCPHGHSLDLLVTGLCCKGEVEKAYNCFLQLVERGRQPSAVAYRVLEGFLEKAGEIEAMGRMGSMVERLKAALPS